MRTLVAEFVLVDVEVDGTTSRSSLLGDPLLMDVTLDILLSDCAKWISEKLKLPKGGSTYKRVSFLLGDYGPVTVETPIGSSSTQCMEFGDSKACRYWNSFHMSSECATKHMRLVDYLCLSEPIAVRFEAISEPTVLFIKTLTGKTVTVALHQNATIQKLKEEIKFSENIPVQQQRVIFSGKQLEDSKTLRDYNIQPWNCLGLSLRLLGGGGPPLLVDVTQSNALCTMAWSRTAPIWREASPGLCLEGKCQNASCKAYEKMVISCMEFQNVDLAAPQSFVCRCPICRNPFRPIKPGFNNCFWKITAVKVSSPESVFQRPWTRTGNEYTTHDQAIAGMSEFIRFQVFVRPLNIITGRDAHRAPCSCPVCLDQVVDGDVEEFCEHMFHGRCWQDWVDKSATLGNTPACPICRRKNGRGRKHRFPRACDHGRTFPFGATPTPAVSAPPK